jgi:hypothetical protein
VRCGGYPFGPCKVFGKSANARDYVRLRVRAPGDRVSRWKTVIMTGVRSGWRGCLRRCSGKSSSDGIAMQSQYRLSALAMPRQWRSRELFVECSSNAFGLASAPVSLKPSRPHNHCRERETNPRPSLSHCERSSASWAKNSALGQSQNCLTRYRLADSRTGGFELLNL